MDSGNSGSMQSSSGGDDQEIQDQDINSQPNFFNSDPTHFIGSADSHPPMLSHYQNHQLNTLFDLSSNYLHALSQSEPPNPSSSNPNFFLNLDTTAGPRSLSGPRSEPISSALPGPSSSIQSRPAAHEETKQARGVSSSAARNSKKRTRASRRAPTTVLNTDTSNFRAMVQAFTGIPAPPLPGSSTSPFSRSRLDIFGSALGPLDPLRPSPQKVLHQPFLSNSSSSLMLSNTTMVDATTTSINTNNMNNNFINSSHHQQQGLIPKQLPYHHHHHHHHDMLNNMQNNPILTFHQSLNPQQQQPPPPFHSSSIDHHVSNFGGQLGMSSHGYSSVNNHVAATSVDHTVLPLRSTDDDGGSWRSGTGVGSNDGRSVLVDHLRPLDGNINISSRSSNSTINYAASSSSDHHRFHPADKCLEMNNNIVSTATRGTEPMVDSWICPSD